jgi:hypothetical protein
MLSRQSKNRLRFDEENREALGGPPRQRAEIQHTRRRAA